jgi:aerobic-type carbon monoxide dehydrogenase small subunit (CoxS/CutS family)
MSSCLLPLYRVESHDLRTAEGLAQGAHLSDLQTAFIECHAFQCGYCTPGMLMSATALLEQAEGMLDEGEIRQGLRGHLCRCGSYPTIVEAIRSCSARRWAAQ